MSKLLIIDGYNIVRRSFGAIVGNEDATHVDEAFRISMGTIGRALRIHKPAYAVVAWDGSGETWRHQLYPQYKHSRAPMAAELRQRMPEFERMLNERFDLASLTVPCVEADDVIATLAYRWSQSRPYPCVIASTDKDMVALTTDYVSVYDVYADCVRDDQWCIKRMGVPIHQLLDLLALTGDSSDDIPGAPQIGPKRALTLLEDYGNLEAILRAAPTIKGALGQNLVAGAELARLSRRLVQTKNDVALGISWSALKLRQFAARAAA